METAQYVLATRAAQGILSAADTKLAVDGKWGRYTQSRFDAAGSQTREAVVSVLKSLGTSPDELRRFRDGQRDASASGIVAASTSMKDKLVAAAKRAGVTGPSLAALVANAQIESGFVSQREGHRFPANVARRYFSALAKASDAEINELVSRGPGPFFEKVYGVASPKGRDLGNVNPGDGGKYYGRGLLQLTGRWNYAAFDKAYPQYGALANPDVLILDENASVDSAVWYWKTFVQAKGLDKDPKLAARAVNPGGAKLSERVALTKTYATAFA